MLKKYLTYKNLNLLLPILGIVLIIIIMFFTSLKIEVEVDGVITDTINISYWKIIFASELKMYYTSIGVLCLLFLILNSGLLITSNLCIYLKIKNKVKYIPIIGLITNFISFILFFALPFLSSDSILYNSFQLIGTNILINDTIKELPILLA